MITLTHDLTRYALDPRAVILVADDGEKVAIHLSIGKMFRVDETYAEVLAMIAGDQS
jgi:hypothetical protein